MRMTLSTRFSTVIAMPSIIGVRASPADRSAPLSMKNISMPPLNTNMMRRNGSASAFTAGAALTKSSSHGDAQVAERRHDAEREERRGEKRLIDGAIDLLRVARAGEARDEHAHAGEQRRDEDDDDEDDLPADADGRVAGEPDEMADQHVIDDALQPADDIGEHRRPRDLPDRRRSGPSTIERS